MLFSFILAMCKIIEINHNGACKDVKGYRKLTQIANDEFEIFRLNFPRYTHHDKAPSVRFCGTI